MIKEFYYFIINPEQSGISYLTVTSILNNEVTHLNKQGSFIKYFFLILASGVHVFVQFFVGIIPMKGEIHQYFFFFPVFEILVTYLSSNDWRAALSRGVPERKGYIMKE